jgi:hypothetical protein
METGARFWEHVDKSGECWVWTGMLDRYGYGKTSWGKNTKAKAHRVAWLLVTGEWPDGPLDHLCRNRRCVRPGHLEEVTVGENVRRGLLVRLRTQCKRGHALTPDNLVPWAPAGTKWCHRCVKDGQAAWRARHKEAA